MPTAVLPSGECCLTHHKPTVGAGLPAKGPLSLAPHLRPPSLASQLLQGSAPVFRPTSINIKRGTPHATANPHRAGVVGGAQPQAFFHHGAAVHHRGDQLPGPQQPVDCRPGADQRPGHRPDSRRPDFLRIRLDLRRHADPRRMAGGPGAAAHSLYRCIARWARLPWRRACNWTRFATTPSSRNRAWASITTRATTCWITSRIHGCSTTTKAS